MTKPRIIKKRSLKSIATEAHKAKVKQQGASMDAYSKDQSTKAATIVLVADLLSGGFVRVAESLLEDALRLLREKGR